MPHWLSNAVFYEIYPQTFYDTNSDGIGDINGITQKLDYVKQLGCNAIWMNPCFDSPFRDAGYDVKDYKKVAPRYGTNEDLIKCFETAHKKGIKILLDLVPGHTSDQHKWFQQSMKAQKSEYSNRYIWTNSVWESSQNYRFVNGMAERDGNYVINFFSSQPALNYGFNEITEKWQMPYTHPDCIATREALKDIMRFWLDRGCDGFRVDMADSLVKNDDEKTATATIWRNVRNMLDKEYPEAALVSEWSYPERSLNCGFHCDFYLNHEGNGYYTLFRNKDEKTGEELSFFSKEGKGDISLFTKDFLKKYNSTKDKGYISFFTCNHDTPRMSRTFDERELKLANAFIFTMPGVPFLYYGDEIGMKFIENLVSKEGGYSRTGTRTPMQWNNGKNLGFSDADANKLYLPVDNSSNAPTVEAQMNDDHSILSIVKTIIKLRHENEDLQADGDFKVLYAEKEKYPFIYQRGKFVIAVNPSGKTTSAPVACSGQSVFAIGECEKDEHSITMHPQSFVIYKNA